jgi:hypothetical protein
LKRRILFLVSFLAGLYYLLEFLLPTTIGGAPDSNGATAPTPIFLPAGNGVAPQQLLCYTGLKENSPPRLLVTPLMNPMSTLSPSQAMAKETLLAPSFNRPDDYNGAENAQFVAPDRLYYTGLGWDNKTPRVCLARRVDAEWRPEGRAVLDKGSPGAWDASGITWVSVLPPVEGSPLWQMWYVGRQGEVGKLGYATSRDGLTWTKAAAGWTIGTGGSVETVSVLPWSGSLRAWAVVRDPARPKGELVSLTLSGTTGEPQDSPEPVAWQAPELRFGNLPKDAIPLRDVRAVPGEEGSKHVKLYLSAMGSDGRPHIMVAENFAVAGEREPTVFARQVKPIVEPGKPPLHTHLTDVRNSFDDLIIILGAFAVGLGLISLAQVHGKRITKRHRGWPESIVFFVAALAMGGFTLYARTHPSAHDAGVGGYNLLFYGLFQPLSSSIFALLAAYLVSAAYRAFRVKTRESALMAAAALLIMLGQVPIGNLLTHSLPGSMQIPTVMAWVLGVANNAVVRAVNFGLFVGALATALRVWLRMDPALNQGDRET